MRLLDIHSHILPGVDDGAKDIESSIKLLEMMKEQGITDVVATPHFDATIDNMEEYLQKVDDAKRELINATYNMSFPNIFIGSEVYYFKGIGKSTGISRLAISGSPLILLELRYEAITDSVISDIVEIHDNLGMIPIIAHIERYVRQKGFKKILKLIDSGVCYAQINAASLLNNPYKNIAYKLIKKGYISFLATDAHSPSARPPLMKNALDEIEKKFGKSQVDMFIRNSDNLCQELEEGVANAK